MWKLRIETRGRNYRPEIEISVNTVVERKRESARARERARESERARARERERGNRR